MNIGKEFFTVRVVRHWHRLPREAESVHNQAGCSSEEPALVEGAPVHGRGLEQDDLSVPFQPKPFCDGTK